MKHPLTNNLLADSVVAWNEQGIVNHSQFLDDVRALAARLPEKKYAINLCEDRYQFMVAFAAVIVKQQTNLLPQSRATEIINAIAEDYTDSYCIVEHAVDNLFIEQLQTNIKLNIHNKTAITAQPVIPQIHAEHIAAIAFTSGSTGKPQANSKTWHSLVIGAQMAAEAFGFNQQAKHIVATVPPQHMYGLETSILYTLQSGCPVYAGRPFYPEDIRTVCATASAAVILVTTPVHLRACNKATDIDWTNIERIISATAPLSTEQAEQAEKTMHATVSEIFGCTEVGSMANRETLKTQTWSLYKGIRVYNKNNTAWIHAPHVGEDVAFNDVVEIIDEHHFKLLGRNSDMVNIAGKRGSIADITLKLQQIDGIDDAAVFLPDNNNDIARLMAFVKTNRLNARQVSAALTEKIDSVFIPRPLYIVDELPYNATGKLTRQALIEFSKQFKNDKAQHGH